MITIYKYPLIVTDEQEISMPLGAEILTVQTQNGIPCLWAKVDTSRPVDVRGIQMYGTGHPMESGAGEGEVGKYVGTFQLHGGSLVFHVFDRG